MKVNQTENLTFYIFFYFVMRSFTAMLKLKPCF